MGLSLLGLFITIKLLKINNKHFWLKNINFQLKIGIINLVKWNLKTINNMGIYCVDTESGKL